MRNMKGTVKSHLELCKVKISLYAAFSAALGFLLASSRFRAEMILTISGVFILACGSSALNQYQERKTDALMKRTRERPLPSGRTGSGQALGFCVTLILSGSFILFAAGSYSVLLLGLFASLWYNGFYTYLKRKTAFAVIPGALVGAIPPAIGWVAGGGALKDPKILTLCFFFFMWQVPHSWALLLNYGKEYEEAGLPSLSGLFSRKQLARIISNWVFATMVSCLLVFLYGFVHSPLTMFVLLAASFWFVWQGIVLARGCGVTGKLNYAIFKRINYYMLIIMSLLSLDRMTDILTGYGLRILMKL